MPLPDGVFVELGLSTSLDPGWMLGEAGASELGETTFLAGGVSVDWTDVTADVMATPGVTFKSGMVDGRPSSRVAASCDAQLVLDNSIRNAAGIQGLYSPERNTCLAGFRRNVPVRIGFLTDGVPYYKWLGRLKVITPTPGVYGEQVTVCEAVDFMDDLARAELTGLETQRDVTADVLLRTLIAAMDTKPQGLSFDVGTRTFDYGLVGGKGGTINGLQEAQRITLSEVGYLYLKGGPTDAGILRFEHHDRRFGSESSFVLGDEMADPSGGVPFTGTSSVEDVVTLVRVTSHPRKVDGSLGSEVILYSTERRITVAPGETVTTTVSYRDPAQTASVQSGQVAADGLLTPSSGTDFDANTAEDGGGADITGDVPVSVLLGSTGSTVTIGPNANAATAYVFLRILGIGLYDYDPQTAISIADEDTRRMYGVNKEEVDQPYQSNANAAQFDADLIAIVWGNPFAFAQQVTFIGDTDEKRQAAIEKEIGDRVTVGESQTGIFSEFFIQAIQISVIAQVIIVCTWTLAPASFGPAGWKLGVAGRSELGETTLIGVN